MIYRVFANNLSFREVWFRPGFNIVLAERTEASTPGDSRNGVGKSTLIEIIHFCFGATANPDKGLRRPELSGWKFSVEFDLTDHRIVASRSTDEPGRVVVSDAKADWPIQPRVEEESGEQSYSQDEWKAVLAWGLFGLPTDYDEAAPYKPSFRSLFSYICRRKPEAYSSPFKHFPQQRAWDSQIHIAFLLGLSWRNASKGQQIRDELEGLAALKKAAEIRVASGFMGTEGELQARQIELDDRLQEQQRGISSFKVHPEYERYQNEATRLTVDIQQLTRMGVLLRRKRDLYNKAVEEDTPPGEDSLEELYREAGVALGDGVRRTLQEARVFHQKIVSNRQEYLTEEIARLEVSIHSLDKTIRERSDERASIFAVLESHGAFDEFARLNEAMARTRHEFETVTERLNEVTQLIERQQELREERLHIERAARRDYNERRNIWSRAVRLFNANSEALYDSPGRLIIDVDDKGFKFKVEIQRQGSQGIAKMEVFCFDLMVAEHLPSVSTSPGLLVHDSILFDGVDSRQRARALMRAADRSAECGFQYICTLNTDMVPYDDFDEGFDINQFVRLTLHDGDASGSLLGIRF